MHGRLFFLQLLALLRHPLQHPKGKISAQAFGMGGREIVDVVIIDHFSIPTHFSSCGKNW